MNTQTVLKTSIEHLADTITLRGVGIDRLVYLDNVLLNFDKIPDTVKKDAISYNWGYKGSGPNMLAFSIANTITDNTTLAKYLQAYLQAYILHRIINNNFEAVIRIKDFMQCCMTFAESKEVLPKDFGQSFLTITKKDIVENIDIKQF